MNVGAEANGNLLLTLGGPARQRSAGTVPPVTLRDVGSEAGGMAPTTAGFGLFEWLDDDTGALGAGGLGNGLAGAASGQVPLGIAK